MMKKGKTAGIFAAAALAACMLGGCANALQDGTRALENGQYEEARDIFETAAEQEDGEKSAEAYRGLGMAYYEMEEYGSAMKAFQTALDRGAGQTVQIYNLMGICAMNVADYESALEYFQSGLALADTESVGETDTDLIREMRYNEIVCCERTADWESAKQKAAEYLQDYPGDEAVEKEAEFLETR